MREHYPQERASFGDHFRVGRYGKSWPVGGGILYEPRTLRSMSYGAPQADHTQWGRGGQTSTQIVELSTPIKSWGYLPIGQSDDPSSPHHTDQAEKVFSKRQLKSSWWTPQELMGNIKSRSVIEYSAAQKKGDSVTFVNTTITPISAIPFEIAVQIQVSLTPYIGNYMYSTNILGGMKVSNMPSTVNIIGTGHYGKKNKETRQGTCTQCETKDDLSDYDTRHAICVLFIPVIPLGKRRIMSHCKACDRWLHMSWKDWNAGVEVMEKLIEEGITGSTPDREKTLDALGMVYQLQSITTLYDNLDQLYAHYKDDEEIMAAVAAVMVMLYDFTNAHIYAVRAFELNQSDDNRELLGVIALNTDKLSEAHEAFQFIITNSLDDKYDIVLALVEAYQTKGQHQEALDLLDALPESFPDRAQSKPTHRLEKISNKNLGTSKAIIPKAPPEKIDVGTKFILATIAVLFVVAFIGFSLWEGFKRNVYFINGLSAEYTIDINGDSYTLPAAGLVPIPLGDGNFIIHVKNETLELPDVTLSIDTGFFTRLFTNDTYIINPDTCGIILWENIPYAEELNERLNDRYESIVHFGSSQYFFEGIHFPFKEVPDEISLDSDAPVTMRKSLANYSNADYKEVFSSLYDSVGSEGLSELFRLTMLVNPDDEDIFYYATSFLTPKNSVKLLTPHLDNHLDDVNFHRNYQETAKKVVEYETLINRYEGYLNASPNSPD